jgi:hypothetical protein
MSENWIKEGSIKKKCWHTKT